jgi:hypothetical protein
LRGYLNKRRRHCRRAAIRSERRIFGPESAEVADDLDGLKEIHRAMGHEAEVREIEERMNSITEKLAAQGSNG